MGGGTDYDDHHAVTDAEHAAVLRRYLDGRPPASMGLGPPDWIAAIERAIELLEREAVAVALGATHVVKGRPNESPEALWHRAQDEVALRPQAEKYR